MKKIWGELKTLFAITKLKVIITIIIFLFMPFYNITLRCYGIFCPKVTFFGGITIIKEVSRELTQGIPSDFFVALSFLIISLLIPYIVVCIIKALYYKLK